MPLTKEELIAKTIEYREKLNSTGIVNFKITDDQIKNKVDRLYNLYSYSNEKEAQRFHNTKFLIDHSKKEHIYDFTASRSSLIIDAKNDDEVKKYAQDNKTPVSGERNRLKGLEKVAHLDFQDLTGAIQDITKIPEYIEKNGPTINLGFTLKGVLAKDFKENKDLKNNETLKFLGENSQLFESIPIIASDVTKLYASPLAFLYEEDLPHPNDDDFEMLIAASTATQLYENSFVYNKDYASEELMFKESANALKIFDKESLQRVDNFAENLKKNNLHDLFEYKSANKDETLADALYSGKEIVKKDEKEIKADNETFNSYDKQYEKELELRENNPAEFEKIAHQAFMKYAPKDQIDAYEKDEKEKLFQKAQQIRDGLIASGIDALNVSDEQIKANIEAKYNNYLRAKNWIDNVDRNIANGKEQLRKRGSEYYSKCRDADFSSVPPEKFDKFFEKINTPEKGQDYAISRIKKVTESNLKEAAEAVHDPNKLFEYAENNTQTINMGLTINQIVNERQNLIPNSKQMISDNKDLIEGVYCQVKDSMNFNASAFSMLFEDFEPKLTVESANRIAATMSNPVKDPCHILNGNFDMQSNQEIRAAMGFASNLKPTCQKMNDYLITHDVTNLRDFKSSIEGESLQDSILNDHRVIKQDEVEILKVHDELHRPDSIIEKMNDERCLDRVKKEDYVKYCNENNIENADEKYGAYLQDFQLREAGINRRKNEDAFRKADTEAVTKVVNNKLKYEKINWFFRTFSHLVPNSWTDTGKLRNEISHGEEFVKANGHQKEFDEIMKYARMDEAKKSEKQIEQPKQTVQKVENKPKVKNEPQKSNEKSNSFLDDFVEIKKDEKTNELKSEEKGTGFMDDFVDVTKDQTTNKKQLFNNEEDFNKAANIDNTKNSVNIDELDKNLNVRLDPNAIQSDDEMEM